MSIAGPTDSEDTAVHPGGSVVVVVVGGTVVVVVDGAADVLDPAPELLELPGCPEACGLEDPPQSAASIDTAISAPTTRDFTIRGDIGGHATGGRSENWVKSRAGGEGPARMCR